MNKVLYLRGILWLNMCHFLIMSSANTISLFVVIFKSIIIPNRSTASFITDTVPCVESDP